MEWMFFVAQCEYSYGRQTYNSTFDSSGWQVSDEEKRKIASSSSDKERDRTKYLDALNLSLQSRLTQLSLVREKNHPFGFMNE